MVKITLKNCDLMTENEVPEEVIIPVKEDEFYIDD